MVKFYGKISCQWINFIQSDLPQITLLNENRDEFNSRCSIKKVKTTVLRNDCVKMIAVEMYPFDVKKLQLWTLTHIYSNFFSVRIFPLVWSVLFSNTCSIFISFPLCLDCSEKLSAYWSPNQWNGGCSISMSEI